MSSAAPRRTASWGAFIASVATHALVMAAWLAVPAAPQAAASFSSPVYSIDVAMLPARSEQPPAAPRTASAPEPSAQLAAPVTRIERPAPDRRRIVPRVSPNVSETAATVARDEAPAPTDEIEPETPPVTAEADSATPIEHTDGTRDGIGSDLATSTSEHAPVGIGLDCGDPWAGIWTALAYHEANGAWGRETLRIPRADQARTAQIRLERWTGHPEDRARPACGTRSHFSSRSGGRDWGELQEEIEYSARAVRDAHSLTLRSSGRPIVTRTCGTRPSTWHVLDMEVVLFEPREADRVLTVWRWSGHEVRRTMSRTACTAFE